MREKVQTKKGSKKNSKKIIKTTIILSLYLLAILNAAFFLGDVSLRHRYLLSLGPYYSLPVKSFGLVILLFIYTYIIASLPEGKKDIKKILSGTLLTFTIILFVIAAIGYIELFEKVPSKALLDCLIISAIFTLIVNTVENIAEKQLSIQKILIFITILFLFWLSLYLSTKELVISVVYSFLPALISTISFLTINFVKSLQKKSHEKVIKKRTRT